ncbi:MAG: hypothetical protein JSS62_00420 [Verrucomicrobia bacterium]|nr:hypothetical protein [Verrucomicrobiota bacterium]MBS0646598.1 hypothetical protein [Verrucomicrobiota bacterium]
MAIDANSRELLPYPYHSPSSPWSREARLQFVERGGPWISASAVIASLFLIAGLSSIAMMTLHTLPIRAGIGVTLGSFCLAAFFAKATDHMLADMNKALHFPNPPKQGFASLLV